MTKIEKNARNVMSKRIESSSKESLNLHGNLKKLLVSHNKTIEDKIATVKTAQLIDKGRVETALKTLMKR